MEIQDNILSRKIHNHLISVSEKRQDEYVKTAISPTDAKGCARKIFWSFQKNIPRDEESGRSQLILSMGNAVHERIQGILQDMGIQIKDEYYLDTHYKDMPIHGYVDSICLINGKTTIVEIKSQKEWNYGYGSKSKCYRVDVSPEHYGQVQMYMHFTGIHEGIVLYENKNTSELKEFHVEYDREFFKTMMDELYSIWLKVRLNETPDRPNGMSQDKYPCTLCKFRTHCYKDN